MDWVPVYLYGQEQVIAPGTMDTFPLMDPQVWAGVDEVEGRIEDQSAYQLIRVVGQFNLAWQAGTPLSRVEVPLRLWPCFQDQLAGAPIPPGLIFGGNAGEVANEKWWWERRIGGAFLTALPADFMDPFVHPWWSLMDAKVNQWIDGSMVPCLSVHNTTATSNLLIRYYLRMLIGRTAGA